MHPEGPVVTIYYEGRKIGRSAARVKQRSFIVLEGGSQALIPNMVVGVQVEATNGPAGSGGETTWPAVVLSVDSDETVLELECSERAAMQILGQYLSGD